MEGSCKLKLRTEDGLTLVEILAVVIITSLVALLIFSIMVQSTKTYENQSSTNRTLNDAAYALKVITKEIRKNPNDVTASCPSSELEINHTIFTFDEESNTIKRNNIPFVTNIKEFAPCKDGNAIEIRLISIDDQQFSTTLYLRN